MSESLTIAEAQENLAKAKAVLKRVRHHTTTAAERAAKERRIVENTIMVLRGEGPWRRLCTVCNAEIEGLCVGGQDCGEIIRCQNGHDCSARFKVVRIGGSRWLG